MLDWPRLCPQHLIVRVPAAPPLSTLTALSPLDGRYGELTAPLRDVFSEFAFMRARLRVEVEWLIRLSLVGLPELKPLPIEALERLRALVRDFSFL